MNRLLIDGSISPQSRCTVSLIERDRTGSIEPRERERDREGRERERGARREEIGICDGNLVSAGERKRKRDRQTDR